MEEQPERETNCPQCGGEPTEESEVRHRLSDMGYLHDDQTFTCQECNRDYTHGVPVGDPDVNAEDLWCDVCNLGYMTVHRVKVRSVDQVRLHLKCHHHHSFDCPECDGEIPVDGVRTTGDMSFRCPLCEDELERSEIPYCFYFNKALRKTDHNGVALIGFPTITGQTEGARPYGWSEEDDENGTSNT